MTRVKVTVKAALVIEVAGFDSTIEAIDIEQAVDDMMSRGGAEVDFVTVERFEAASDD